MLRSLSLIRGALKTSFFVKPHGSFNSVALQNYLPTASFPASKAFHVQAKLEKQNEVNVDRSLLSIDREIRKTGRINRSEIEEILEDIREMKQATSSQSLMIIRCCGELVPAEAPENRTKLVQEVWKTMESLNVPVDISHYNALLKVYLENEYKFNPAEFLQDLSNKGIEPNRVTYQRLIAHFCQQGNIDGATTILQHMKEKQLPINEHVFNALVLGHAQAKDMESAEGMLSVMSQAGLEPNDDTYITLMSGYAKIGDIENVRRIIKECEEKEIFLVDRDFLNVIYTLATNGQENLVDEIIPYLRKHSGFNQEATNVILRLVNAGKMDVGYKILQLMPRGMRQDEYVPSGTFFIKQMILSSTPSTTIIKYCREMAENGLNQYALSRACEIALTHKKFEKAFDLLEALKESGFPMRQHYFWPFFAGKRTEKEIYDGLKCMMFLEVVPSSETLREYVVPALFESQSKSEPFDSTIDKLSGYARIPVAKITPCALQYFLSKNDLTKAAKCVARYKIRLFGAGMRRALVQAYVTTGDAKNVARIIAASGAENEDDLRELAGLVLLDAAESGDRTKRLKLLQQLLKEFVEAGLGISNSAAELIQNSLGEGMTPEIANIIVKLTSGDSVRRIEPSRDTRRSDDMDEKTVAEFEQIEEENAKLGRPNKGLQKTLLLHYCRERNLEKAEKLQSVMREQGFTFGPNLKVNLLDLYSEKEMLDNAKEMYSGLRSSQLEFVIDELKVLRYVNLLAAQGQHEEVLKVISENKKEKEAWRAGPVQTHLVWKLLNAYAEQGKSAEVKEVLDSLVEHGLAQINNVVLGPLIKSHLVRDDLDGAMAEFERCVNEHRASPWKQELFARFIKAEDAERLQKVLDLSTSLYGEVNSLYDLVFAFVECGKLRQAKKILDTPGLRARNEKLEMTCQKYLEADRIEDLENLVEITKDVFNVDRNSLYHSLLKAYIKKSDTEKALSIWTSLQEENVQASRELLVELANFLQKNNQPVPFIVPEQQGAAKKPVTDRDLLKFREAIRRNDVDVAAGLKNKLERSDTKLSWSDKSSLVNQMVRAERINDAVRLIEEMAETGNFPNIRVLRAVTKRLQSQGDVDTLTRLSNQLPSHVSARVRMQNSMSFAMLNAGKTEEYFTEKIKNVVESSEPTESPRIIPPAGVMRLLEVKPEYLPEVEALSQKCADIGILGLNAGLWLYYLKQKDFPRARDILNTKVQPNEHLLFKEVINQAKDNLDLELANELWDQLQSTSVNSATKGLAAGCVVDVLRSKGESNEALQALLKALQQLKLSDFVTGVLNDLKTDLESKNQTFPFEIPKREGGRRNRRKEALSSDSDSDSDSD